MSTIDSGDTAWVLASTALVFLMTPALGSFYGGMVSASNVVNTHMMSWVSIGVIGIHWVLFGYSFSFGRGTPGFGSFQYVALVDVGAEPDGIYSTTVPHTIFMVFQMTFAIITGALISGAVVERMKLSSYVIFLLCWTTIVYDLIAHMAWAAWENDDGTMGYGFLRNMAGDGTGAIDFAGGTVVHITSGWSALVAAIIVGKRRVWNEETHKIVTPHNVPMILTGAGLIWFGWFGFNGGSALAAGAPGVASIAFANTQISAATSMLTWIVLELLIQNKGKTFSATGAATGAVVGLVVITPASGFVKPIMSIPIGIIGALVSFFALQIKKRVYISDDTLDAWACHGVGGVTGAILTGFFATKEVNPFGADGVFYGNPILLGYQIAAVLITIVVSVGFTVGILLAMKYIPFIGLRVKDMESEVLGMDKLLHNELGYNFERLHAKEGFYTSDGYYIGNDASKTTKHVVPPPQTQTSKQNGNVNGQADGGEKSQNDFELSEKKPRKKRATSPPPTTIDESD